MKCERHLDAVSHVLHRIEAARGECGLGVEVEHQVEGPVFVGDVDEEHPAGHPGAAEAGGVVTALPEATGQIYRVSIARLYVGDLGPVAADAGEHDEVLLLLRGGQATGDDAVRGVVERGVLHGREVGHVGRLIEICSGKESHLVASRGLPISLGGAVEDEGVAAVPTEGKGVGGVIPDGLYVDVFALAGQVGVQHGGVVVEVLDGGLGEGRHEAGLGVVIVEEETADAPVAPSEAHEPMAVGGVPIAYL